ncbi:MAG TPA: ATP phosphoribosyltransferase [Gammaproteobacteria bacterium]|nr:ATP phosphoribosyltransferase [Gammaproteobacteria bacterium]
MLTIALSKGRILEQTLPLLAALGIRPDEDLATSRRLILGTSDPEIQFVVIRAADVPTYVEYGAADVGIAGKDVLMEYQGTGLYEPLDLGIARCRLVVAGRPGGLPQMQHPRVATKYPLITREFYARRNLQPELIKLYGSMELAPLVGLADRIVDLVDTGNTLRANGLVEYETIAEVSAWLVVNKASMKLASRRIRTLVDSLAALTEQQGQTAA